MRLSFNHLKDIKEVEYSSKSIEHYDNVILDTFAFIPGCLISGKDEFDIRFKDINENIVKFNLKGRESELKSYTQMKYLKNSSIQNKKLLAVLGDFFKAFPIYKNEECLFYQIKFPNNQFFIPYFNYLRNKNNESQYFMLSASMPPRERSNEQSVFFIERIWQVEFEHEMFMKELGGGA